MGIIIIFNNNGTFYSGNVVQGKVVLHFSSNKNIRGIRLKIRGREHTRWEVSDSEKGTVVHYGDIKFIAREETLQGGGRMTWGTHTFPFSFLLPKNIPSTYKGAHGGIRYYLKAVVDIPMGFDHETEKDFTVISLINFNEMVQDIVMNPVQYQYETKVGCCCAYNDPITVDIYMEKDAFVINESIKVKMHIINMSNGSVENVRIQLKRTLVERCTYPSTAERTKFKNIISTFDTGVGAHGDRHYPFELKLPQNFQLPNFVGSKLFGQKFKLKIQVGLPGCSSDMEFKIPIKLGHIAVQGRERIHRSNVAPFPTNNLIAGSPPPFSENNPNVHSDEGARSASRSEHLVREEDRRLPIDSGNNSTDVPPPSYYEAMAMITNDIT